MSSAILSFLSSFTVKALSAEAIDPKVLGSYSIFFSVSHGLSWISASLQLAEQSHCFNRHLILIKPQKQLISHVVRAS